MYRQYTVPVPYAYAVTAYRAAAYMHGSRRAVVRNDDFSFPEGRNHALCGYACPDGISQGYLGFIGITRIQRLDSHSPSPFLIPNDTLCSDPSTPARIWPPRAHQGAGA